MQFEDKEGTFNGPLGGSWRFTSDASAWVVRLGLNYIFGGGLGKTPIARY